MPNVKRKKHGHYYKLALPRWVFGLLYSGIVVGPLTDSHLVKVCKCGKVRP